MLKLELQKKMIYDLGDLATLLKLSSNLIKKCIENGELPAKIIGKEIYVSGKNLIKFINKPNNFKK